MFKIALTLAVFSAATAGRLENLYLPPSAGGVGSSSGASFSASGSKNQIPIVRADNNNNGDGTYNYAYETGNGIAAQENGKLSGGSSEPAVVADGSFSFTAPDGQQFSITYTADENGFHPQGAHLPTSPPIPEAILKSLEQNRAEESRSGGQYSVPSAVLPLQQEGYKY